MPRRQPRFLSRERLRSFRPLCRRLRALGPSNDLLRGLGCLRMDPPRLGRHGVVGVSLITGMRRMTCIRPADSALATLSTDMLSLSTLGMGLARLGFFLPSSLPPLSPHPHTKPNSVLVLFSIIAPFKFGP